MAASAVSAGKYSFKSSYRETVNGQLATMKPLWEVLPDMQ